MEEIPLVNSDKITTIDDEDYKEISKHRWVLTPKGYVKSSTKIKGKQPYIHRFIINPPNDLQIDHIDHDPLNNTRSNLRIATNSQNHANGLKFRGNKTSRYKGVCWYKNYKKWEAGIMINYKHIKLGYFASEVEAATAYDMAALKYFREFSKLNFPERIAIE
jgi:hypothetical protein